MMGLGWQELVIVLVIVLIIFGAGKLPQVAKSMGQGVKEFKTESGLGLDGGPATTAETVTVTEKVVDASADPARI